MEDEWSKAAKELTDPEREIALRKLLDSAGEVESGIIRQLLGKDGKELTKKQQNIYDSRIEPSLVENVGCQDAAYLFLPGQATAAYVVLSTETDI